MPLSFQGIALLTVSRLPWIKVRRSLLCLLHWGGLSIPGKFCLCCLLTFSLSLSFFFLHFFCLLWHSLLLQSFGNPGIPLTMDEKLGDWSGKGLESTAIISVLLCLPETERCLHTHSTPPPKQQRAVWGLIPEPLATFRPGRGLTDSSPHPSSSHPDCYYGVTETKTVQRGLIITSPAHIAIISTFLCSFSPFTLPVSKEFLCLSPIVSTIA